MTYHAPRGFAAARPHLALFMTDDPHGDVLAARERERLRSPARQLTDRLVEDGIAASRLDNRAFLAVKGFETLAWETAAIEALQAMAVEGTTYIRVKGVPEPRSVTIADLEQLHGAMHVVIDDLRLRLQDKSQVAGVTFIRSPLAITEQTGDLPAIQVVVWPRENDVDWTRRRAIGHFYAATINDPGRTLQEGIEEGVAIARRRVRQDGFNGMFASLATTSWDANLARIIAAHAAALVQALAVGIAEPEWQSDVPAYLLKRLEGPKAEAAAAALLRRGFVREHRVHFVTR